MSNLRKKLTCFSQFKVVDIFFNLKLILIKDRFIIRIYMNILSY